MANGDRKKALYGMKMVVLDGYTLNPGDLSWEALKSIGPCDIYDRTSPADLLKRADEADILLTNKTDLRREHIERLRDLKYIGVLATGTNVVDLQAARLRGIPVTNIPTYGTRSVAQATIALLLELTNHVGLHARSVREGKWSASVDWCYWELPLVELDGLTMGIVGFGRIGRAVSELASAFGMEVLACDAQPITNPGRAKPTNLDTLFRQADVVTLHCPLTSENKHLVNADRLATMKPSALLLNTSRGPLVEERALAEALNSGRIAGAGLDVLPVEPPPLSNPLLQARNCVITPHVAWATKAARARLLQIAIENIQAFLGGKPRNVVNP
jgi:glycerate dehydrogenase